MSGYTFLKKPYTPVVPTSAVKTFNVYGKSFYKITNIYLSGHPYENQTFYNPFSGTSKLSAYYPGFYGIRLPPSNYTTNNTNTIVFTMPSATRTGYVDIIVENSAGYGILTQYVIKEIYTGEQSQLELRPWSLGIEVNIPPVPIPDGQIYTIANNVLVTINNDNIITI